MNEDEIEKYRLAVASHTRAYEGFVHAWEEAKSIKDEELRDVRQSQLLFIWKIFFEPQSIKMEKFYEELREARGDDPDSFWNNQYEFLENGDMQAARRLAKRWFPRSAIFVPQRWNLLRSFFLERISDDQTAQSNWEQLITSALLLAWDEMELEKLYRENNPITSIETIKDEKHSAAYHSLIKDARTIIMHDLLNGTTTDRKQAVSLEEEDENKVETSELELISRWEVENDMQVALSQLSKKEKQVFDYRVNGSTYNEIAEVLGMTPAAVRKMHERALKKARKKLLEYLE